MRVEGWENSMHYYLHLLQIMVCTYGIGQASSSIGRTDFQSLQLFSRSPKTVIPYWHSTYCAYAYEAIQMV